MARRVGCFGTEAGRNRWTDQVREQQSHSLVVATAVNPPATIAAASPAARVMGILYLAV